MPNEPPTLPVMIRTLSGVVFIAAVMPALSPITPWLQEVRV